MVEVEYKEDGPVALVSLNAPERLNALSPQMRDDLGSALDTFEASSDARVAILTRQRTLFLRRLQHEQDRQRHLPGCRRRGLV